MATSYYSESLLHREAGAAHTLEILYRMPLYYKVVTALVTDDILCLCTIPDGLRVAGGLLNIGAGGHTVTAKIGDYTYEKEMAGEPLEWTGNYVWTVGTDNKFGSLTDMTDATSQTFADTAVKGCGYPGVLTNGKETRIGLLFAAGANHVDVNTVFEGYLNFGK